jgi:hypothetical protein
MYIGTLTLALFLSVFDSVLLAAVLGAAEVGVQLFAAVRPTPYLAMAAAVCSLAASIARLVAQPRMHDERDANRSAE